MEQVKDRPGSVVWVCENGHIDHLHRKTALDLCARCRDGVCTPKKTLGRRSKEQRDRDRALGIHEPRKRRTPVRQPTTIRIIRPGEDAIEIEAEALSPSPEPPFKLNRQQRTEILSARDGGKLPEITFPQAPPDDRPDDLPWPASPGDVLEVTSAVRLVVLGKRFRATDIALQYLLEDQRPPRAPRFTTTKAREDEADRMGGPEFRAEREPGTVDTTDLTAAVHTTELHRHEKTRADLRKQLKELASAPRDVRFPLGKTIEGLDRRIDFLRRELGLDKPEEVAPLDRVPAVV